MVSVYLCVKDTMFKNFSVNKIIIFSYQNFRLALNSTVNGRI